MHLDNNVLILFNFIVDLCHLQDDRQAENDKVYMRVGGQLATVQARKRVTDIEFRSMRRFGS